MATTRRAGLTLMPSNVLKNEAIFNQDITLLEVLVYGGVISQSLLDPSGISPAPTNGDAYIVPQGSPSPTGDFSGKEGQVAVYFDGWRFIPADEGLQLRVVDEDQNYRYENGAWVVVSELTDTSAIHDNVAGEIAAVASKASPTSSDILLIEDAAASNAKKRITIGSLPSAGTSLAGLSDVDISGSPSPDDLDYLGYNRSTGKWEAKRTGFLPVGGVRLTKSGNQSIANNTITSLTWGVEDYDTLGAFNSASSTTNIVVPAGISRASIEANCSMTLNTGGGRAIFIRKNGATVSQVNINAPSASGFETEMNISALGIKVATGDIITIAMFQTSGIALNAVQDARTHVAVIWMA